MREPTQPPISLDAFVEHTQSDATKRLQFAAHPRLQRDESGRYAGSFNTPFKRTIGPIFENTTGIRLYDSRFKGLFRSIKTESEFEKIKAFHDSHIRTIFLNDLLALSTVLDFNFEEYGEYTHIGRLEKDCKDKNDPRSLNELSETLIQFIRNTPFFSGADFICAVPPAPSKEYDLPSVLCRMVSEVTNLPNITSKMSWKEEKPKLKALTLGEKWGALENSGLQIDGTLSGADVILLDDLYQSGTTLHYVAGKLLEAGASRVYGLCIVKSWRDTDNTIEPS